MKAILPLFLMFLISCSSQLSKSRNEEKAEIFYKQGTQNLVQKNYTKALKDLLEAVKLDAKNSGIHNNLGMAYYFKNESSKAIQHINKAIELDPGNSDARGNLASIYMEQSKYEEALSEYKKILKDLTYERQFKTYYNLGLLSLKLNDNQKAVGYFKKSVEENNNFCPSHFQIGMIAFQGGFYKDANKSFKDATKGACFENPAPHYYQGLSYLELGIPEQAKAKFDFVVEKHKDSKYSTLAQLKLSTLKQTKIPASLEASNKRELSKRVKEISPNF